MSMLMLFSSVNLLFSCDKKEEDKTTASVEEKKYDEDSIYYERSLVSDELEPRDFGGRPFRVVTIYPDEVYIEKQDRNQGDLLKDATFLVTNTVEKRFNTEIQVVYDGYYTEVRDYISKTVLANSDEFDLAMGQLLETGGIVEKGLFLNWYDIDHINFSKPWWYKSSAEELTYDGKCILAVSHLNHSAITETYCIMFNKELAQSYELGNLYDVVLNGDWTYDYFIELVKDIYRDNGNDKRDKDDIYGMSQIGCNAIITWAYAFDNPICKKNSNDIPEIALNSHKIDTIVDNIYDMCYNTNGVWCDFSPSSLEYEACDLFYEGRAIFTQNILKAVTKEELRNFEDDYGILPMPKFDETQKDYKTMSGEWQTTLAVPKTCKDTDFVGTIVEALSAQSWKTWTPTFYEIALKTRYLRDNESKKVLDILIENTVYDFGYVYHFGLSNFLSEMILYDNNNFQSYFKRKKSHANYNFKQILKAFDKL
jgi:hypothetical protein